MEAAANDQLDAIVRVPVKIRLELPNEISRASVQPVIDQLHAAQAGSSFELHLRHNGGGCVNTMIDLIVALNETKGMVEITFGRYVMSAAATIWLWFMVRGTPNVQSLPPLKPGVVMYHRPRRVQAGEYICFADEVEPGHPLKEPLEQQFKLFDDLFNDVHRALLLQGLDGKERDAPAESLICEEDGLTYRHWLARLQEAYLGNQDVLIPV
ncbi:hypothetical protein M2396_002768 [Pseudomonas sp. BIGb0278]|uniref:hypothetical protein n=1 Tax=Pseudomonas sp. BIGb0278 TaxID=2940607 RepID=UPI00216853D0|nr:hypothetical protein [Pseudomonas sp. BIGb0278]MCS4284472.1 hypothetical protein [Pseudomonas sp. BIGb0278]